MTKSNVPNKFQVPMTNLTVIGNLGLEALVGTWGLGFGGVCLGQLGNLGQLEIVSIVQT